MQQPVHHEAADRRGEQAERLCAAHRCAVGAELGFERGHEDAPGVENSDREVDQNSRSERKVRAQRRPRPRFHRCSTVGRATVAWSGGARPAYGRWSRPSRGGRPASAPLRARRPSQSATIQTGRLSSRAATAMPGGPNRPAGSDAATVAAPRTAPPIHAARGCPSRPSRRQAKRKRQAANRGHDQRRCGHRGRRQPRARRYRGGPEADNCRRHHASRQPQQSGGVEERARAQMRGPIRHAGSYSPG